MSKILVELLEWSKNPVTLNFYYYYPASFCLFDKFLFLLVSSSLIGLILYLIYKNNFF